MATLIGEYERQEHEARDEAFRENLEHAHRDDPEWWAWYEAHRKAERDNEHD